MLEDAGLDWPGAYDDWCLLLMFVEEKWYPSFKKWGKRSYYGHGCKLSSFQPRGKYELCMRQQQRMKRLSNPKKKICNGRM